MVISKPDGYRNTVEIDVRETHREAIEAVLAEAGGTFAEYGKPNTILLPSRGSPPIPYYSPRRPNWRLRLLCWFVGARLDYLPDRPSRTVPTPRPPEPPTKLILPSGIDEDTARRVLATRPPEPTNESVKE